METKVYNQEGKEIDTITLPKNIFDISWNPDLVHEVAIRMASNKRAGTAHTKFRSEVRGGGKKPWRQKGTGRARHGSIRSPIWIGGGVAHGPRKEKNYKKKINKKEKTKALFSLLSQKLRDKEIFFVDKIELKEIKTKEANKIKNNLSKIEGLSTLNHKKRQNLLVLDERNEKIEKSFRNIPSIYLEHLKDINVLQLLNFKRIIFINPEKVIEFLKNKLNK